MADEFKYDVFLSNSTRDDALIAPLAQKLKKDGLRVWYAPWEIRRGDRPEARVEEGLEQSRVLVLCMSRDAFGPAWRELEADTLRFRDPQNSQRRFIP